jgi:hypothetical protein
LHNVYIYIFGHFKLKIQAAKIQQRIAANDGMNC